MNKLFFSEVMGVVCFIGLGVFGLGYVAGLAVALGALYAEWWVCK